MDSVAHSLVTKPMLGKLLMLVGGICVLRALWLLVMGNSDEKVTVSAIAILATVGTMSLLSAVYYRNASPKDGCATRQKHHHMVVCVAALVLTLIIAWTPRDNDKRFDVPSEFILVFIGYLTFWSAGFMSDA